MDGNIMECVANWKLAGLQEESIILPEKAKSVEVLSVVKQRLCYGYMHHAPTIFLCWPGSWGT